MVIHKFAGICSHKFIVWCCKIRLHTNNSASKGSCIADSMLTGVSRVLQFIQIWCFAANCTCAGTQCTTSNWSNILVGALLIQQHGTLIPQENDQIRLTRIEGWAKDAERNGEWVVDTATYAKGVTVVPLDVHNCRSRLQKAPLTGPAYRTLPFVVKGKNSAATSGMDTRVWIMELAKQVFFNFAKPTKSCKTTPSATAAAMYADESAMICQKVCTQCTMLSETAAEPACGDFSYRSICVMCNALH